MNAIESLYTFRVSKDTTVFKGSESVLEPGYTQPSWYTLNKADALQYGPVLSYFKTKKDLTLINVQNLFFHTDFINRVNEQIPVVNEKKVSILAPLGLPSLYAQNEMIENKRGVCYKNETNIQKLRIQSEYFGGKHRYSFKNNSTAWDYDMVKAMLSIYKDRFDGYISPYEWPSCYHETNFHPEICIFKPKYTLVHISSESKKQGGGRKKKTKKKGGGADDIIDYSKVARPDLSIEEWNKITEHHHKAMGWPGPKKYDEDGMLMTPSMEFIHDFRLSIIEQGMPDVVVQSLLSGRRARGVLTPYYDAGYWDSVKYK